MTPDLIATIARIREAPACEACHERRRSCYGSECVTAAPLTAMDRALTHRCDACAAIVAHAALPDTPSEAMVEAMFTQAETRWGTSVSREAICVLLAAALRAAKEASDG